MGLFGDLDSVAVGVEEGAFIIPIARLPRPIKDSKAVFPKTPGHAIDGVSRTERKCEVNNSGELSDRIIQRIRNRVHLHEFEPRPIGERKEVGAKSFLGIHIEIIGSRSKVIHIEGPQGFEVPRVDRNMLDFHEKRNLRKTAAHATSFRHGILLHKKLENSVRLSRKFGRN
jgi:hypothetical protein